ncbi:MAG TPA: ROK family transcriptional regulator [Thermoanaerobaculia bacterium]|nr:ROK family transcriptional regulator [Thermoanaerobaculia bacterium]
MRRIDPNNFRVATRATPRQINRQIALNLVRERQPISRADLARSMNMRRGAVSLLVNELIEEGIIFEGATGETSRGRKPKFLFVDTRSRCAVAVDIRPTRTFVMVTDLVGRPLVGVTSFATEREPKKFVAELARRIRRVLSDHEELGDCAGVGIVVPGMVDRTGSRVLFAPRLGWHDLSLLEPLEVAIGLPVSIENSGRACALAQLWATRGGSDTPDDFVFVSVSDGLGVGVIVKGELLRGQHNVAGEFGHMTLNIEGPRCACGANGCWEAYVSNLATLSRYFGRNLAEEQPLPLESATLTIDDLVALAHSGDNKALSALQTTARYLGLGLASVVNAVDPARIYIGGEIAAAWDLIETTVRSSLKERTLRPVGRHVEIVVVPADDYPRLKGAAALVAAPSFAAPVVA